MYRRVLCCVLLALGPITAHALVRPVPVAADPHFKKAPYVHDVYEVKIKAGKFFEIELSESETDIKFAMGDRKAWIVQTKDNIIGFKPAAAMPDTNLKVWSTTSDRVYWFKLVTAEKGETETWHLSFEYPPDPPKPVAPAPAPPPPDPAVVEAQLAEQEQRDIEHAFGGGPPHAAERAPAPREFVLNGNYGVIGPEALTPTSVYDNGEQTVMTFAPNNPWPVVMVKEDDGSETRVSQHTENDMLVIHRVARKFVLRHLGQAACLINGSFSATGPNNATKTVSDRVIREVKKGENVSR